ncbi:MAG TPA: ATP-dependent metallopeptidase FtsH/Yme1/Tma family protein, partial [Novosphingobium sp.]|nr:ATP-dependent metallopeptidase FtsH/Yme1/Tma family protein [Novosphingobium sp.]
MNDDQPSGTPWMKSLLVWGGIFLALFFAVSLFGARGDMGASQMQYSDFRAKVAEGSVMDVAVGEQRITGHLKNGETFSTIPIPNDTSLQPLLAANNVKYAGKAPDEPNVLLYILANSLPFVLILGVAFFALRQVQKGGGSGAMGFGKSKAKLLTEKSGRVTFNDVAGIDEAREELEEIVEFLRDPGRFSKLGGQIPKGALLVGSPGTGKTLLARAIAGEAGVPFFTISGS